MPQNEWQRKKRTQEFSWRQKAWIQLKEARTPDMRAWQDKVMERYNGHCVICQNEAHTGHHAYTQAAKPTWRFEPWNGVPVCWLCHRKVHSQPDLLIAMQLVAIQQMKADRNERPQVSLSDVAVIIRQVRGVFTDHKAGSQRIRDILFADVADVDMPLLHEREGGW